MSEREQKEGKGKGEEKKRENEQNHMIKKVTIRARKRGLVRIRKGERKKL